MLIYQGVLGGVVETGIYYADERLTFTNVRKKLLGGF